jgi:hypothetical protein
MMSRPTKYNEEMQAKADGYADNFMAYGDPVPTVAGLADALDVSRATLYNWSDEHPQFLDTLGRIENRQHKFLVAGGLTNEFNAGITKLMLHNHGYSDKSETDVTSQGKAVESLSWTVVPANAS